MLELGELIETLRGERATRVAAKDLAKELSDAERREVHRENDASQVPADHAA